MKNEKAGETKRHAIAVFGAAVVHILIFVLIVFAPGRSMEGESEKSLGPVYIVFEEEKPAEEIPPPPEEKRPVPKIEFPIEKIQEPEPAQDEVAITNEKPPEDAAAETPGPNEYIALEHSPEVDNGTNAATHVPNNAALSAAPSPPDDSASIASRSRIPADAYAFTAAPVPQEPPPYTPPKPLSPPEAVYPASSKRRGEEGTVRILIYVNETGNAAKTEIETSSGYPVLDKAALDTAKTFRFTPATKGGRPVSSEVVLPIRFSLSP